MTDFDKFVKAIFPYFVLYMKQGKSGILLQKGLDNKVNPSIHCDKENSND